jgi:peroxiredoxin
MPRNLLSVALVLLFAATATAGKYNPTLSVGDAAPKAPALHGIDGKEYALVAGQEPQVTVLAFTCNTCPYAVDYEDRLNALAKSLEKHAVRLIVVNANSGKRDDLDAMRERAKEKKFTFTYVKDADGKAGHAFGATRTPEFVVLDRDNKVVYLGAMDDDSSGKNVRQHYVEDAVAAALAGKQPDLTETPPIGCNIKYPRERRE